MDIETLKKLEKELGQACQVIRKQRYTMEVEAVRKEIPSVEEFPAQFNWDMSEIIDLPLVTWMDEHAEVEFKAHPKTNLGRDLLEMLCQNDSENIAKRRAVLNLVAKLFGIQIIRSKSSDLPLTVVMPVTELLKFVQREDVTVILSQTHQDLDRWLSKVQDFVQAKLEQVHNLHSVFREVKFAEPLHSIAYGYRPGASNG